MTVLSAPSEGRRRRRVTLRMKLLIAVVGIALATLAFLLGYFGPHTVRDLASVVGRSVGTVTKQLSRAHKSLRKLLNKVTPTLLSWIRTKICFRSHAGCWR